MMHMLLSRAQYMAYVGSEYSESAMHAVVLLPLEGASPVLCHNIIYTYKSMN